MTRTDAIARAVKIFDDGRFEALLARRVAIRTETQEPGREQEMRRYLDEELSPELEAISAIVEILANPAVGAPPWRRWPAKHWRSWQGCFGISGTGCRRVPPVFEDHLCSWATGLEAHP